MSDSRVAVIAIHGVGDHQPFEMARAVGDMLEDLEDGPRQPRYCTFGEDWVRLNVEPVKVEGHAFSPGQSPAPGGGKRIPDWGPLDALLASKRKVQGASETGADSLDHLFMEGQLAEYKGEGPEDTYEVLRLQGRRRANAPVGTEREAPEQAARTSIPEKEVHIYDMFWSDLSGVATAGLRIFGELYQLLFHLGSIGVNNVNAAAITLRETAAGPAWVRFATSQKWAAALLAKPIPILNLIMLAFTAAVVLLGCLAKLTVVEELTTMAVVVLAAAAGFWGRRLMKGGPFSAAAFRWPVILFLVVSAAVSIAALLNYQFINSQQSWSEVIEVVAGLLLAAAALFAVRAVITAYDKLRPGASWTFTVLLVLVVVAGTLSLIFRPPPSTDYFAMSALIRFIEVIFWLLAALWQVFFLAFVLAFLAGWVSVRQTATTPEADRAQRTNWTARLTLALPAVLFLLLTFGAWSGVLAISVPLLPHHAKPTSADCDKGTVRFRVDAKNPDHSAKESCLCYGPLLPPGAHAQTVKDWSGATLFRAGVGYTPAILLLVCFAAIISVWGLTPSILTEVFPPRAFGPDSAHAASSLGEWLDQGYRFMRWAGRLIYLGVFAFPLTIALFALSLEELKKYEAAAIPLQEALGALIVGAGVGILGFGGRLSKLALGFRPLVRVALDVDNWMREHPRDSNPTARICGRYVSLLRYIAQWRGQDGRGYDALIVFAHSQGTVITADFLRFLEVEKRLNGNYARYDQTLAGLDTMKRYLFTVGCPLRQLYGLRFPYLYGYAPTDESSSHLPNPEDLGVDEWVNVYRTGDYVGRYLWRPHPWQPVGTVSYRTWNPPQGIPQNVWHDQGRVEFTIGPGAHTHYWDSTAEPVAETLDVLISKA